MKRFKKRAKKVPQVEPPEWFDGDEAVCPNCGATGRMMVISRIIEYCYIDRVRKTYMEIGEGFDGETIEQTITCRECDEFAYDEDIYTATLAAFREEKNGTDRSTEDRVVSNIRQGGRQSVGHREEDLPNIPW